MADELNNLKKKKGKKKEGNQIIRLKILLANIYNVLHMQADEAIQEILHGDAFMWYVKYETQQQHSIIESASSNREQQSVQWKQHYGSSNIQ
jgi:hypothetical protein